MVITVAVVTVLIVTVLAVAVVTVVGVVVEHWPHKRGQFLNTAVI